MLAKTQPTCAIMPERLTADPFKQAPECIGSGPFRWVADEFVSGSRAVMAKFEAYVPRPEKVEYGWGGYHVKVDRVEWRVMPDPSTAANALVTGEVDWVEMPLPDLLPMLRNAAGVTVGRIDTHGVFPVLRPNFIVGPTANVAVRRAMLAALSQTDAMTAVMGDDREGPAAGYFFSEIHGPLMGKARQGRRALELVRGAGLEPARVSPYAPQAYVSAISPPAHSGMDIIHAPAPSSSLNQRTSCGGSMSNTPPAGRRPGRPG